MSKNIAVYGGSFNPITKAHIEVIQELGKLEWFDEIWVVPCGRRRDKPDLISGETWLEMMQKAFLDAKIDE